MKDQAIYSSEHIQNLQFPDDVRMNASLYLGSVDAEGRWLVARELLDNGLDEFLAKRNDAVYLYEEQDDSYTVIDNGFGIPQGIKEYTVYLDGKSIKSSIPTMQAIFGQLNTSGKYRSEAYKVSIGSHGQGSKSSNATSEFFHVKTYYQGKWYEIEFKQGHLTIPVRECQQPIYRGKPLQKGTMIHFKHDKEIFGTVGIDFKLAESWAEITSYLNPGFHVTLQDKQNNTKEYYSEKGPSEYVEKLIDQLHAQREEQLFTFKNELCDVVVAFSNAENCNVRGYTNGLYNSDGGKHVDSVCQALFNVVKDFAKAKQIFQLQDFKEGLVGIINMHLHKAEFSSQDKLKLTDDRAGDSLRQQIQTEAEKFFKKNKELAQRLCEKSTKLLELRSQFKASKKMIAALNQAKKRGMPAKYSPFDSKTKVEDRELLIVEGLSAAGGLRQVRKPYQSLYPIKGKIKNLAKTTEQLGLESEEIINILSAIGYDPNKENPLEKPLVSKIICLADADDDGPVSPKTRVLLCDGTTKTIKELADQWEKDHQPIWVWSLDAQGKLHPAKAIEPRITCHKTKYARVYFDDSTRIACTLNHKFAINSAQSENLIIDEQTKIKYIAAKDLQAGDSIMSAYFKNAPLNGNKGSADYRYVYHDDYQRKYYPLHKLVAEDIYPEEYAIYAAKNKENKNSMAIHHKDHNRMNNSPENLEIISAYAHTKDHHSFNKSGYNGSALQKQKLKEYHTSDKYRNEELPKLIQRTVEYNKSEKNRQSTAALNRRDDVKELQQLTRLSKKYLCIQEKYGQVTQMLWACTFAGAASTPSVIRKSDFARIRQHLDTHKYIEPAAIKKVFSEDEVKDKFKFAIKRFILTCKSLYKENAKLTKELYNKFVEDEMIRKGSNRTGAVRWETAIGYLETFNHIDNENNIEQFIKEQCNNHRVVKVEIIELDEPKPFYCLIVPQYGNFLLADKNGNGICSSNCHINTLLLTLFFKICPELFEKGMIYVADMYDFYAIYKDQVIVGNSAQEVQEKLHKLGAPVYISSNHVKGWGELDQAVMKVLAVDKETRKLIRIKPITDHDRTTFVRIMNDDVEYRRKMLGLADNV